MPILEPVESVRLPSVGPFREMEKASWQEGLGPKSPEAKVRLESRLSQEWTATEENLEMEKDESARKRILFGTLSRVIQAQKVAIGDREPETMEVGSIPFVRLMQKVNGTLLSSGYYLHVEVDSVDRFRLTVYRTSRVGVSSVDGREVRVAFLRGEKGLATRQGDPVAHLHGLYLQAADIAVIDEGESDTRFSAMAESAKVRSERAGSISRIVDSPQVREDFRGTGVAHELGHAHLRLVEYDPALNGAVLRRLDVPMGSYVFPKGIVGNSNNAQLHELFAGGMGLMGSGESASLVAHTIVTSFDKPNYHLAMEFMWREVVNSPELDPFMRVGLLAEIDSTRKLPIDKTIVAIGTLSPKELHRIGGRMAKAALWIAGK
jgi:hypothetical protein